MVEVFGMVKVEVVKSKNSNLRAAKRAKNDEFYTQLTDIEKELRHYIKHFKGKTVFCNCDDPFESNFFKYFALNFNRLGLKKLIATSYVSSDVANDDLKIEDIESDEDLVRKPYKAVVTQVFDKSGDGGIDMEDIADLFKSGDNELTALEGDGDFRSEESIELLKEADIVVTNPPFSLFREYVAQLMEYDKKFLVLGNMNAITYKETFPLLKENKIWLGHDANKTMEFQLPPVYERWNRIDGAGNKFGKVPAITWYTNLDLKKRHEELILVQEYSPEKYPKYDNYGAIEVSKVVNIPLDYDGVMGVPITFLDKYNPEQFEIVTLASRHSWVNYRDALISLGFNPRIKSGGGLGACVLEGKCKYARILIRNRHPEKPEGEN